MTDEDYLPCSSYENQPAHPVENGFSAFFNKEESLFFFALLDADGKVLLKSEGYPQQAARENGIQSVKKNRENKDFYSVKNEGGRYYLSLRAANYREIARTCSVATEAEAWALLPFATGEQIRGGQPAAKERANDKIDDDYLACKEYTDKPDVGIDGYSGLVKFTHDNGLHYFAWYDDDNNLLMRSEGYPTTAARDNGMASVAKNRELEERYATIEKFSRYFTILKAGNHQEIARSCSYESAAAAMAIYPSARAKAAEEKVAALAAAAAASLAAINASKDTSSEKKSDREDDNYLACKEYQGHGEADENGITQWQHTNGEYYFAWLNSDGSVKMRSEGYATAAARDNGISSLLKNREIEERYSSVQVGTKHFAILKAGNHQEIARSCAMDTPFVWAKWLVPLALIDVPSIDADIDLPVAPILGGLGAAAVASSFNDDDKKDDKTVIPPPVYAAATEAATATSGGFNWLWLLPLLLLLPLLWFLLKGCNKEVATVASTTTTTAPVPPIVVDTVKSTTPKEDVSAAVTAATKSCELNWLLFDFDKADLTSNAKGELDVLAKILKDNPTYIGVVKAYTDWKGSDAYNEALSARRADSAKSYLVKQGIDASRIITAMNGKKSPVAKNTNDDTGRRFNRRVELYVQNKERKNVCASIAPEIPANLKAE